VATSTATTTTTTAAATCRHRRHHHDYYRRHHLCVNRRRNAFGTAEKLMSWPKIECWNADRILTLFSLVILLEA
jgi:hypothetical protein